MAALHVLVLVDASLGVAAADLSQRLVLVAARTLVLHVENVVVRHTKTPTPFKTLESQKYLPVIVLHQVQFLREQLNIFR